MKKEEKAFSSKIFAGFILSVIVIAMISIFLRFFTWNFLVDRGINNYLTKAILFDFTNDNEAMGTEETDSIRIDWAKEYPFSKKDLDREEKGTKINNGHFYDSYEKTIKETEESILRNIRAFLPFYKKSVELLNSIEQKVGWKIVSYNEYNGVILADDNYLVDIYSQKPVEENVKSIAEFYDFCKEQGIDFLYAQEPSKVCKYEDADLDESLDFSNKNFDCFLQSIRELGIDIYDHREDIHNENLNHHSLFYGTDHHWKAENGRWAAKHLLEYIGKKYGYKTDGKLLRANLYEKKVYNNIFLGSQGKKVGLKMVKPDDFTMLYPKFETKIHFSLPDIGLDKTGNFDIMYNMNILKRKDYYLNNEYDIYNYGVKALHKIENLNNETGPKVLFVNDSFANCEIPFFALGVKRVESIDLRTFTGSLKSYIKKNKPDIVIVSYSIFTDTIDWKSHTDIFDFR